MLKYRNFRGRTSNGRLTYSSDRGFAQVISRLCQSKTEHSSCVGRLGSQQRKSTLDRSRVCRCKPGWRGRDLICAARHQAWVVAISGTGSGVLWFIGLSEELADEAYAQRAASVSASRSAVLQPPIQCSDIDGDGMNDLVVSVLSLGKSMKT